MKRNNTFSFLFIFLIFLLIIVGCNSHSQRSEKNADSANTLNNSNESVHSDEPPKIVFIENEYDFGELKEGEMITHAFKFSNSGGSDLIISDVKASCGCTASDFPREPIKPGGSGIIKLTFDSRGQIGYQNKTATIETNASTNRVYLRIKATVKK